MTATSFDGDGDRLISADAKGNIRDGDFVLAIAARYLKQHKALPHNTVVGTVMSNTGLSVSLKQAGIKLVRTPVGDKYVLDKMLSAGYTLGGEPSGHIIFSDYSKNGDGIVTALMMLKIIKETGKSLLALSQCLTKYPQLLVNVRVKAKPPLDGIKPIREKHSEIAKLLGDEGRIVLRYSGTEPLARVMVEGKDRKQVKFLANTMAKVIQEELGKNYPDTPCRDNQP
ncbi:MAG: hypothetical protein HY762_07950 [Planctomycetes bacterium]|nr:hypothetical protein [Planctomycetota bacterium]